MRRDPVALAFAAAALLAAGTARAEPKDPRGELEVVARALDIAVSKVSHPVGWTLVPEGGAALSYYVAGSGAIFVVAPRAVAAHAAALPPEGGSALSRVMQVVEHTLQQAESPETRERLQKTLDGLKRQQEELNTRAAAQERDRASLQKLTEERLARQARNARQGIGVDSQQRVQDAAVAEEALRRLEAEAAAFQREAEAARQAADNALSELAQEMRKRLSGAGSAGQPGEQLLAGPGEPPVPLFVPPPPWRTWVAEETAREQRPAATVVGEVREAVTGVLETHRAGLSLLQPQDVVVVTVDFVPQGTLRVRVRPERTLVVRVRKQELQEAGRSRIQYIEY
jgi:hypothetical protein